MGVQNPLKAAGRFPEGLVFRLVVAEWVVGAGCSVVFVELVVAVGGVVATLVVTGVADGSLEGVVAVVGMLPTAEHW